MSARFSIQPGNDLHCHFGRRSRHIGRLAACVAMISLALGLATAAADAQDLSTFAVLAGSAITNTGPSVISGNIGVYPDTSITGFPPGSVINGTVFDDDSSGVAQMAQAQLTTLYNVLAGRPATADLTGHDLGGMTLTPGVYNFDNTAALTGTLTLDGQGNPNAVFISTLAAH